MEGDTLPRASAIQELVTVWSFFGRGDGDATALA